MSASQITPPASLPITLAELKAQLRISQSFTAEDDELTELIETATDDCQDYTGRQFVSATWRLTLDSFPVCGCCNGTKIKLQRPPLLAVSAIAYLDSDGNSQTLDSNSYRVTSTSQMGFVWATSWPTVGNFPAAVQITYTAGYATIPARLKHAVKLLAAHWYENREDTTDRNLKLIPMGVSRLLGPFKVFGGV